MQFFDTHTHMYFENYDEDRTEMIQSTYDSGITKLVNVGTDVESTRACLELAKQHDWMWASAGIHPHDAKEADEAAITAITNFLEEEKIVAVGEVGLDFFRDHSPQETQEKVFRHFVQLAADKKMPLIIHCRDAYDRMLEILKEMNLPSYEGVMHCYASHAEHMKSFLELGFYISFAGPLTYKKNDFLREACRECPEDRILLETDAPFLPPQSMRGKRNESSFLIETAKTAAEVRGVSLESIAQQTTENALNLFGLG